MKKLLIVFILLLALFFVAVVIFFFTFDLNRYRPQIEKQATSALKHPVKIGNMSLAWRGGLAAQVDGVQIYSNDEPVLKIQNAGAVLQIAPLLRRKIEIASIFIDGADVRIVKDHGGKIEIQGVTTAIETPSTISTDVRSINPSSETGASQAAAWGSFLIGHVDLKDVRVHYEDDSEAFPIQMDIKKIETSVKNVALFKPIEFEAAAAVFSDKQDVSLSGRLKISDEGREMVVEKVKFGADLDVLEWNRLAESIPVLAKRVPVTEIGGKLKVDIDEIRFKNGKLNAIQADVVIDNGKISAFGTTPLLDQVQLSVNRLRLEAPFDFKIQAAVFSSSSNLSMQGKATLGEQGRFSADATQLDLDLNRLNWNRVESFFSGLRSLGLDGAPEGRIHADIKSFEFVPGALPNGDIDFRYDQGRIRLRSLPKELNPINLNGTLRGDQLSMDAWNVRFGGSPVEGKLNIQNIFSVPVFRADLHVRDLDLKSLIPPAPAGQPQPEGTVAVDLNVGGSGKSTDAILPSLTGTGHFRWDDPVIRNLNILKQIFEKLSAIPGLGQALNRRVSDKLKARLDRRDTPLQKIDQDFAINQGQIHMDAFEVVTPDVQIRGPVDMSLTGEVAAQQTLWVHEEIMAELAGRVNELAAALNSQGQLQVPMSISGKLPRLSVIPDIQFLLGEIVRNRAQQVTGQLASRLASGKGPGKLSQILGVTPYASQETAPGAAAPAASDVPPAEDNSVPVKVIQNQDSQPQTLLDSLLGSSGQSTSGKTNRKAEIAAGILSTLLSNTNSNASGQLSQADQNPNSGN